MASSTDLPDLPRVTLRVYLYTPNAHFGTVEGALIHTSQKRIQKCARFWEHSLDAAYLAEFA